MSFQSRTTAPSIDGCFVEEDPGEDLCGNPSWTNPEPPDDRPQVDPIVDAPGGAGGSAPTTALGGQSSQDLEPPEEESPTVTSGCSCRLGPGTPGSTPRYPWVWLGLGFVLALRRRKKELS